MIRIFLVDDQCLMLESIKAILRYEPGIKIVGTAQDGREAIAKVKKLQPDIVLVDIEMPKINGITTTKYICQYLHNTKVIVLTSHKNQKYVAQALQAGASGYLLKDSLIEDLKQAIYSLSRGYSYIKTSLLAQGVNQIQTDDPVKQKPNYIKKYKKKIYTPFLGNSRQTNLAIKNKNNSLFGLRKSQTRINRGNITSVSSNPIPSKIDRTSYYIPTDFPSTSFQSTRKHDNLRRYLQKMNWLIMAVVSIVLSIIIFS